ncbi:MAG TPA: Hsp20/alpha crystallin family protein [Candidatus Brocadiia bacterium]|nr:Hsp20/alpha crystallin family protein [Candidatus Brocadiia bacterium]
MTRFPFWLNEVVERSPWSDMGNLMESLRGSERHTTQAYPPVNVWGDGERSVLTAEIPGVRPEDVDVSIQASVVTIRARRDIPEIGEGDVWHRHERGHGEFVRAITLPHKINPEKVQATCSNGVLKLVLPRLEEEKTRRIQVKTA